jgi:hypothetical protein
MPIDAKALSPISPACNKTVMGVAQKSDPRLRNRLFLPIYAAHDGMKRHLEHFQAKWEPVRRPEMRQLKEIERFRDSTQTESALASDTWRMATSQQPITIKVYANQRLYDPHTGRYVSLNDLSAMVEDDQDFVVREAKTGEDITSSILKQIILRRASHG